MCQNCWKYSSTAFDMLLLKKSYYPWAKIAKGKPASGAFTFLRLFGAVSYQLRINLGKVTFIGYYKLVLPFTFLPLRIF